MLYHRPYREAPAGDMGCFGGLVLLVFFGFIAFHVAKFILILCIVLSH
jgi:hypothetical protein